MPPRPRPAPRWSKHVDELVRTVASRCRPSLQSELGRWMHRSTRFEAFVAAHQDKIRKKLNDAADDAARQDVRAELLVASLLLHDRRFEVGFERYAARSAGPDLTITYRDNQQFNLEVTRLRASHADAAQDIAHLPSARLASVIASKVRQFPGETPNALVIVGQTLCVTEASLAAASRLLKTSAEHKDDAFFVRHGLAGARTFHRQFLRMSGVLVLDEAAETTFWANPEARRALSAEVRSRLLACLVELTYRTST